MSQETPGIIDRFERDAEPLNPIEIGIFLGKKDFSKKNVFGSVGWVHKKNGEIKEINISRARPSLKKRLSSLEDNKCLILPYCYKCRKHVAGIMLCRSPQKKAYVFDTGGDDGRATKIEEINDFLKKNKLTDYSVDNNSFLFGTIQGPCGCGFHVVNEAEVFKELGFTTDVILQKAQTGELQFLVMSKSSNMMKSQAGNIQIIKKLGTVEEGTEPNVTIQGEYMEFNLGESRFRMSLSNDSLVTNNKYVSRSGLIKSIGDQRVLEAAMRQHQSNKLLDNIKTEVEQRLLQLKSHSQQIKLPLLSQSSSQTTATIETTTQQGQIDKIDNSSSHLPCLHSLRGITIRTGTITCRLPQTKAIGKQPTQHRWRH